MKNVSNFNFIGINHIPINIVVDDRRSLIFNCCDDAQGNFNYFSNLNNRFDEVFYEQFFINFRMKLN
jgi:hypothetical protein